MGEVTPTHRRCPLSSASAMATSLSAASVGRDLKSQGSFDPVSPPESGSWSSQVEGGQVIPAQAKAGVQTSSSVPGTPHQEGP